MGFSKDEKSIRLLRAVKTLFFLITMLISLLLFSAPVLLVIADTLLPSALLSASLSPSSLSLQTLSSHLQNYDFRYSLIDIPLISILRSAIIICKCLIFLYPFGFLNQNNMLNSVQNLDLCCFYLCVCRCLLLVRWAKAFTRTIFGDYNDVFTFVFNVCFVESFSCVCWQSQRWLCQGHGNSFVHMLSGSCCWAYCCGIQNKLQRETEAFGLQN